MSKLIAGHYYRLTRNFIESGSCLVANLAQQNKNIFKCYKADYYDEENLIKVLFNGQTLTLKGLNFWEISSETSKYFEEVVSAKQEELDV